MLKSFRKRLVVGFLITLVALQFPALLRAMTSAEFGQLSEDAREQYFQDMLDVAQKLLNDAGDAENAQAVQGFPEEVVDYDDFSTGWGVFIRNLQQATYRNELMAIKDPEIQKLQVEFTFVESLGEDYIDLSDKFVDSFLQIAKAGKIHSTALALRYDQIERQYGPGLANFASSLASIVGEGRPTDAPSTIHHDEPPPSMDSQPAPNLKYQPGLIADMNAGWIGKPMVLTGTVSRVEAIGNYESLLFSEAGDSFAVCFPASAFGGLGHTRDYSELVGATVEAQGVITRPVNCNAKMAVMTITVPTFITVVRLASGATQQSASAAPQANNPPALPARPAAAASSQPARPSPVPAPASGAAAGTAAPATETTDASAARAKAAQEQQQRMAQQRAAAQQAAQQTMACVQQLVKDNPNPTPGDPTIQKEYLACVQKAQAGDGSDPAAAARAKALQDQMDQAAEQRATALQAAQQRAAEAQQQTQKATACIQQLMKDHPDGARGDPNFQNEYLACAQAK